jgi:trehalose 6-phosphate phosphatase
MNNTQRAAHHEPPPRVGAKQRLVKPTGNSIRPAIRKLAKIDRTFEKNHLPIYLFRAWPEIVARVRGADHWALLLDFDGTLVRLRPRTCHVELPSQARKILNSLVLHRDLFVAIISGRRRGFLQETVAIEGVQYFGLHGGERYEKPSSLHKDTLRALHHARHSAQLQLEDLRGVFVEDKGISFSVHYRQARPATVQAASEVLVSILAPLRDVLRVLDGERVWEILPTEIPGKGPTVQELLAKLPAGTLAVCLGNDDTDEAAFRALGDQITVRVGERCRTNAKFYLHNPAEVLRFLSRFEKELP